METILESAKELLAYSYFNSMAQTYIDLIIQSYGKFIPQNKLEYFESLKNQDVVALEQNHEQYIAHQKSISEEATLNNLPSAHGGRVFGDNKIHIYLNMFKNKSIDEIESVLVHEIFHYFIRPEYLSENQSMSSKITEALVDICAIDFMKKYGIFPSYHSNYARYVIFMREKLLNVGDKDSQYFLIFNASISQIIQNTAKSPEAFISDFSKVEAHNTEYERLLSNISSLKPIYQEKLERGLLRLSSRLDTKEEALKEIMETMPAVMPELSEQIKNMITAYLENKNEFSF